MNGVKADACVLVAHRGNQSIEQDSGRWEGRPDERPGLEGLLRAALLACGAHAFGQEERQLRINRGQLHPIVSIGHEGRDRFGRGDIARGVEPPERVQPRGIVKLKRLPSPTTLSTHTSPPCASTMDRTMASPRPRPRASRSLACQ